MRAACGLRADNTMHSRPVWRDCVTSSEAFIGCVREKDGGATGNAVEADCRHRVPCRLMFALRPLLRPCLQLCTFLQLYYVVLIACNQKMVTPGIMYANIVRCICLAGPIRGNGWRLSQISRFQNACDSLAFVFFTRSFAFSAFSSKSVVK